MKVRFKHLRKVSRKDLIGMIEDAFISSQIKKYLNFGRSFKNILESRAVTVCDLISEEEELLSRGYAFCSPKEKSFSKKLGRAIAERRARDLLVATKVFSDNRSIT